MPLNIFLPPELEQFVAQEVENGAYHTPSEVIRDGLLLLKEREEIRRLRLEELRKQIAVGIEQADRGELIDGAEVFARLREKSRQNNGQNP